MNSHTLTPSHSHARPSRIRRLFPVRRRGSAISDAIQAGREDPGAVQAVAELREKITEAEQQPAPGPGPLPDAETTLLLRNAVTDEAQRIAMLQKVADRLRALDGPPDASPALPAAYLRDVVPGQDATHEPLPGLPRFAGIDRTPDGSIAAGIWLGDGDGTGRFVLDGFGVDWFDALACAADKAARALEAATEAVA